MTRPYEPRDLTAVQFRRAMLKLGCKNPTGGSRWHLPNAGDILVHRWSNLRERLALAVRLIMAREGRP